MKKQRKYTGINRLFKSEAIQSMLDRRNDGSLREFLEDWKWIFSYSKKYKWAILFYLLLVLYIFHSASDDIWYIH